MPSAERMKAKVCLVGETAVGKTSLIRRYVHGLFDDRYATTLGMRVFSKDMVVPDEGGELLVKMLIWDVMGETTILPVIEEDYFHNAQGIIAVCDLTRFSTFERLPEWLGRVKRVAGDVPITLAVNKVDLKDEVLILYDEYRVQQYAGEVGARWWRTSARTGENVEAMFRALAADVVAHARGQAPESISV